jgi:hypothetical protein
MLSVAERAIANCVNVVSLQGLPVGKMFFDRKKRNRKCCKVSIFRQVLSTRKRKDAAESEIKVQVSYAINLFFPSSLILRHNKLERLSRHNCFQLT